MPTPAALAAGYSRPVGCLGPLCVVSLVAGLRVMWKSQWKKRDKSFMLISLVAGGSVKFACAKFLLTRSGVRATISFA